MRLLSFKLSGPMGQLMSDKVFKEKDKNGNPENGSLVTRANQWMDAPTNQNRTTIKAISCVQPRPGLVRIPIGRPWSKQKLSVTSEDVDSMNHYSNGHMCRNSKIKSAYWSLLAIWTSPFDRLKVFSLSLLLSLSLKNSFCRQIAIALSPEYSPFNSCRSCNCNNAWRRFGSYCAANFYWSRFGARKWNFSRLRRFVF